MSALTREQIKRAEKMRAEFQRRGDHDGQRIMEAALRNEIREERLNNDGGSALTSPGGFGR